jgi:gliding motility-associated-like protein
MFRIILFLLFILISRYDYAQNYVFGQLTGNPLNTTGWNLTGNAFVGDTPGDADAFSDELVLTNVLQTQSGGIFYTNPINLSSCSKWTVEFDYRLWGGPGSCPYGIADGLAFCFIDVPPAGFVNGGGIGIPQTANGLKVVLDTYENGCGANPELQIFSGIGYDECAPAMVKLTNINGSLNFIRNSAYQSVKITYVNGLISLYLNNNLYLTATFTTTFTGYMGFTASTGGGCDQQSIKNAIIYTEQAISDAGPVNGSTCSDVPLNIGVATNPLYSYSWSPAVGLSSTSTSNPTLTLTNSTNSPITYIYTVSTTLLTNFGACPTTDEISITINPIPTMTSPALGAICSGTPLNFPLTSNVLSVNYSWLAAINPDVTGASTIATITNPTINNTLINSTLIPQTVDYTVTPSSNPGACLGSPQTVSISVNPTPTMTSPSTEVICSGETLNFSLTSNLPSTYSWLAASSATIIGETTTPTVSPTINNTLDNSTTTNQNVIYTITPTTTADACVGQAQALTVTVNASPILTSPLNGVICSETPLNFPLTSNIPSTFSWVAATNPNINGASILPILSSTIDNTLINLSFVPQNVDYTVTSTTLADGCIGSEPVTITVNPKPVLLITPEQEMCSGKSVQINVSGATIYQWGISPVVSNSSSNQNLVSPSQTSTYEVIGLNIYSCSDTVESTVIVHPNPIADFSVDRTLLTSDDPTITISNLSTGNVINFWDFGDDNQIINNSNTIDYSYPFSEGDYLIELIVSSIYGCLDSTEKLIQIKGDDIYYVPNCFTPDGDEFNNSFLPIFTSGFDPANYELTIYNRWGEIIFVSKNHLKPWDGTFNNKVCMEGLYTFTIKYKNPEIDRFKIISGHINLLR